LVPVTDFHFGIECYKVNTQSVIRPVPVDFLEVPMPDPVIEHPDPTLALADPPLDEPGTEPPLVEADLLVEDVSIDGMCGVY
jgi:mycofactocin precursor